MLTHAVLNRINALGEPGLWRCRRCDGWGTLAELNEVACTDPRPATDDELIAAIEGQAAPDGGRSDGKENG